MSRTWARSTRPAPGRGWGHLDRTRCRARPVVVPSGGRDRIRSGYGIHRSSHGAAPARPGRDDQRSVSGTTTVDAGVRTLVVRCPDWPLTALGVGPLQPALVLASGRVVAATPAAREAGVARGQRLREAQFWCPEVRVLERDDSREARRFEAVVAALQDVTPWLETWHPGSCSFGVKGPVRLSGGEANLVRRAAWLASGRATARCSTSSPTSRTRA